MAKTMFDKFEAARRSGVPIIGISTADQNETTSALAGRQPEKLPVLVWDAVMGIAPFNDAGTAAARQAGIKQLETIAFVEAMVAAQRLPRGTILIAHNAHRQLQSQEPNATASSVQAVANLRDSFKKDFRTLVMLAPVFVAPQELTHDVVFLKHELPDEGELKEIVSQLYVAARAHKPTIKMPTPEVLSKAVVAVSGLSAFSAEQQLSMSLTENGLDMDDLWERTRQTIEQTPGLSVWRGKERFSDLVGLDNIKAHLRNRMKARTQVGVVAVIDEIDKVLANVEHDTSNNKQDQMRTLLTEMENNEWLGLVAAGMPGGGKTAIAKAFANEAGVPCIMVDLAATESKFVGESEAQLRHMMDVIKAVGRGNAYFIATSNLMTRMRPELQRRFTDNVWFFDLLTEAERKAALGFYVKKYELTKQQVSTVPPMDGWTGAEIRNLCRYAWDTNCTLTEAAKFIVPMAQSRADEVDRLRQFANGTCLDATNPGTYTYDPKPMKSLRRAIMLPDSAVAQLAGMQES